MRSNRIIEIGENYVTKASGKRSLEEEIAFLGTINKKGILVPEVLNHDLENDRGKFERINGSHEIIKEFDFFYNRGFLEGKMAQSGYFHPSFATSFDDTMLTNTGNLYLIDADEQFEFSDSNKNYFFGVYFCEDRNEFFLRTLPSMSRAAMINHSIESQFVDSYLKGFKDGIGNEIAINTEQPSFERLQLSHCLSF